MTQISMTVNGKAVSANVEDRTLLVTFIREHLGLTGTHVGCETSQCGACTVHDHLLRSCDPKSNAHAQVCAFALDGVKNVTDEPTDQRTRRF